MIVPNTMCFIALAFLSSRDRPVRCHDQCGLGDANAAAGRGPGSRLPSNIHTATKLAATKLVPEQSRRFAKGAERNCGRGLRQSRPRAERDCDSVQPQAEDC